jgi:metallo-beta-lactamase class B
VLIDGTIPAAAPQIAANIRTLGFRVEDVKLILNSHAHSDHAGGIAALAKMSGARVAASPWSAKVIGSGDPDIQDPQYGSVNPFPGAGKVEVIANNQTLRVGPIAITSHFTPGHTPSGTSWSWDACDGANCHHVVYADSQTPVSADDFFFTRSKRYTTGEADFARGLATLDGLKCDVLITPHPGASSMLCCASGSSRTREQRWQSGWRRNERSRESGGKSVYHRTCVNKRLGALATGIDGVPLSVGFGMHRWQRASLFRRL